MLPLQDTWLFFQGGLAAWLGEGHSTGCLTCWLLIDAQDKAILQNRLETAINNAEGFGLR